jgi:hypothetical protein
VSTRSPRTASSTAVGVTYWWTCQRSAARGRSIAIARAAASVGCHAAGASSVAGKPSAARSSGQRIPVVSRSVAVSRIAATRVASLAAAVISVTRAPGAWSRAACELPMASTPGISGC